MRVPALLLVLGLLPFAVATHPEPVPECDIDDDLYNHCHVHNVYWVTGACFGIRFGSPAECIIGRDTLGRLLP